MLFGSVLSACGGNFQIPLDVFDTYQDASTAPRYFGLPSEYADMFGFIRGMSEYLDDYEDAAVLLKNYTDKRYDGDFPVSVEDPLRNIAAIVRCKPGDKEGPKVVHLVDWDTQGSFNFRIKGDAFFPGYKLKVRLFAPKPYDPLAHTLAENDAIAMLPPGERRGPGQSAAYKRLVDSLELDVSLNGNWSEVAIPELNPWGILVIEKGENINTGFVKDIQKIKQDAVVYPNPFADFLKIESGEEISGIGLLTVDGKTVLKNHFNHENDLIMNTGEILPGLYILKINYPEKSICFRIIKV